MDLKDFIPKSDTIEVTLKLGETVLTNPDETPMTITVYAPHTKEYKKAQREEINKRLKEAEEKGLKTIDPDSIEDSILSVYAATTKAWNITFDGKKVKLTEEKAKQIYNEVFWIKNQIDEAVNNSLDFMKV